MRIANDIKLAFATIEKAKEFMKFVKEHSQTTDKSLVETLMSTLTDEV